MTTLTFDTHDIIKKLREKGLSEDLAEYQVEAIKDVVKQAAIQLQHDYDLDNVATKRDLRETELKIELVRAELKRDIAESKAELIRWVVGIGVLQTALIAGLVLKLAGTV